MCCRGYAFITFTNREEALEAVKQVKHFLVWSLEIVIMIN